MKFKSEVAPWYYLLMVLPVVIIAFVIVNMGEMDALEVAIMTVATLSVIGLPVWLLFSTYYLIEGGVEGGTLIIRSGPLKVTIPIREIHSVTPSRSLLSAPALSLNRLKIVYGNGKSILVSPEDQEGFRNSIGQSD